MPESSVAPEAALPPALDQLANEGAQLEAGQVAGDVPGAAAAAPPAPPPEIPTADFLEGMLGPLAELAPHVHHGFAVKPIKSHEVKMLAFGWAAVLDHYFPRGVSEWGPWGVALGATFAVVGPRLVVPPPAPKQPPEVREIVVPPSA